MCYIDTHRLLRMLIGSKKNTSVCVLGILYKVHIGSNHAGSGKVLVTRNHAGSDSYRGGLITLIFYGSEHIGW